MTYKIIFKMYKIIDANSFQILNWNLIFQIGRGIG